MPAGGTADGSPGTGPTGSPMTTPQPQEGLQKAARVEVQIAVKQLQRTLAAFPIESAENKAVLSALKTLSNAFGKTEDKDRELIPAEIMSLLSSVTGQTPGGAAMSQKPAVGGAPGAQPGA